MAFEAKLEMFSHQPMVKIGNIGSVALRTSTRHPNHINYSF